MSSSFERPRGTRDFRPDDMHERRWLEGVFRETFRRHGYREIQTPTFEHTALFLAKSGPNVVNEIYTFRDKGDREVCLRPELTAPVMRFYVNDLTHEPKPLKLYYFGPCYRYEEPQEGRYREFWQFGLELLGPEGPNADAEVIAVAHRALREAGLQGFTTHVGHIGLLRLLVDELGAHGLEARERAEVFRKIDKDADDLEEFLDGRGVPPALAAAIVATSRHRRVLPLGQRDAIAGYVRDARDALGADVRARHAEKVDAVLRDVEETLVLLGAHGIGSVEADLGVARGLDYYTGIVFEFHATTLGSQSQIGGGGAYTLAELFGGEHVGSCGFGLGFDRILLALKKEGAVPAPAPAAAAYVAVLGNARPQALDLARRVRDLGISTDVDTMGRGLGKALQHAAKLGARVAVIVGEKGLAEGKVTLRDLASGEQHDVPLADAPARVEKMLA